MKIQCDVCESQPAAVFCTADEAALCEPCDRRVHHANKLARKHLRLSLLPASRTDSPLCDICQDRRAFLFCKEDRAILCRECDVAIHGASEHTQRHSRFLLTAIKVSASSSAYPDSSYGSCSSRSPLSMTMSSHAPFTSNYPSSLMQQMGSSDQEGSISTTDYNVVDCYTTTSSGLVMSPVGPPPAWHVDDLLESSFAPPYFGSKTTTSEYEQQPSGAQQEQQSRYGHQYYYY